MLTGRHQDMVSVLLAFAALEIVILSLERAKWIAHQPSLTLVLILAVLAGIILERINNRI